jgi:hypothetical protein
MVDCHYFETQLMLAGVLEKALITSSLHKYCHNFKYTPRCISIAVIRAKANETKHKVKLASLDHERLSLEEAEQSS